MATAPEKSSEHENRKLARLYAYRFGSTGLDDRNRVWTILCRSFFDRHVVRDGSILELACGYGEFINHIDVQEKYAVDLNPDAKERLKGDIDFHLVKAHELGFLSEGSVDRVFTSNFLEHLPDKNSCDEVLAEVRRVLKPGGKFMILGPNIKYLYAEYWDFYDHYLPLSHLSLAEGLIANGFDIETMIDRFLPYSMQSKVPTRSFLVETYLRLPFAWRFFGKQFFVVGRKPSA